MRGWAFATCCAVAWMLTTAAAAVDYAGYLTVNDDDYGYWEGRVMVLVDGERVALDEQGAAPEFVFALSHDLARGLVRQYINADRPAAHEGREVAAEAASVASGKKETAPPRGDGTWVRFPAFSTFGFGQYEGSDATLHVYCEGDPEVWAWMSGPRIPGESDDDAASRVILDELDMARLRFSCPGGLTPSP